MELDCGACCDCDCVVAPVAVPVPEPVSVPAVVVVPLDECAVVFALASSPSIIPPFLVLK